LIFREPQEVPVIRRVAASAGRGCALVLGCALLPAGAFAISISGTIQYSGGLGPVSSMRPIKIEVSSTASKLGSVAHTTVTANGGRFIVNVATAGNYYLWFFLDVNKDGRPNVGEPFQVYDRRFTLPADPITAPQSGVNLSFDDTGLFPGIAGTVTYTGRLGQVSSTARVYVEEATDADLAHLRKSSSVSVNGGHYEFVTLDSGPYYLRAFFDVNGNHRLDAGEPLTIYDNHAAPPGDPVDASPTQTGIALSFGDDALASGTPGSSGTPTPTATPVPCIGACNGGDTVNVDDLLALVNIVLGDAPASACPAAGGGGRVTVSTILAAAGNALRGCAAH
jgi:hypothetical protein